MQLTKKELKQIIAEEIENISAEKDDYETLVEGFTEGYEVESETEFVSKDSMIDFLEVLSETKIPKVAVEAFLNNLSEELTYPILKEALEK